VATSAAVIEEFRQFIPDDELARLGPFVQQFPKSKWDRGALSQLGVGVVGTAICAACLAVSFTVVVSDKPEEQLPFQQAMWGFAAVGAILSLYGFITGAWRAIVGVAHVGRWWLLFERGLVIVNVGKLQHLKLLSELRVQTPTSLTAKPRLVDDAGSSLPLPVGLEDKFTRAIQEHQRKLRSAGPQQPREHVPYALAWAEGKLFGEDRVFRMYADGQSVLLIYAGQFVAEKLGAKMGMILPIGTVGVAAIAAQAYGNWMASRDYDKRAAYLDEMSIEELREEAANNKASAVLTLASTTAIHLGPAVTRFWSSDYLQSQVKGRLTFQHHRKTWELAFFTVEELTHALHALTTAFGHERLTVEL
jgi:hypothetical protein